MALISADDKWVLAFGILGNIASFIVFLAPVPTFVRICKKKSTEAYESLPYLVTLFSATLWIYYAMLKPGAFLLITINAFGSVVETLYLILFLVYAHKKARVSAARTVVVLNLGGSCLVLLTVQVLTKAPRRAEVLGWICVAFAVGVFVAPLSIMRRVIRTKSVEFMPFHLSFFLLVSAVVWLLYGVFLKDLHVMLPNVLGLVFGILQIALYGFYRTSSAKNTTSGDNVAEVVKKNKSPDQNVSIDIAKLKAAAMVEDVDESTTDHQSNQDTNNGDNALFSVGNATSFVQKDQDHTKLEV